MGSVCTYYRVLTTRSILNPCLSLTGAGFLDERPNVRKTKKKKRSLRHSREKGGDTEGVDLPVLKRAVCVVFDGWVAHRSRIQPHLL